MYSQNLFTTVTPELGRQLCDFAKIFMPEALKSQVQAPIPVQTRVKQRSDERVRCRETERGRATSVSLHKQ